MARQVAERFAPLAEVMGVAAFLAGFAAFGGDSSSKHGLKGIPTEAERHCLFHTQVA
jgi:hypothetical protein